MELSYFKKKANYFGWSFFAEIGDFSRFYKKIIKNIVTL